MAELTPRNDTRKKVSVILTRVDQWIKNGELAKALLEVECAAQLDPGNVDVQEYRQKIHRLEAEASRAKDSVGRG